jgi:hypothetical protein
MLSRLVILLHLLLVCVCLNYWLPADCRAQDRPRAAQAAAGDQSDTVSWQEAGWGRTLEEAEQYALEKVRPKVETYLRRRQPPIQWTPPADYLRDRLRSGQAKRCEDRDQKMDLGRGPEDVKCWTFTVTIGPNHLDDIIRRDNEYRSEQLRKQRAVVAAGRMLFLGKVLAALVAALLALLAYVRLDEWTKGYYSRWLAAGLVTTVALGLVLLFKVCNSCSF